MKATLKSIAKECGLSITTVSLILNKKDVRVSQENRKKVLEIAQKNKYQPNSLALGLVSKKTHTIGLVLPDISNLFFSQIAKNIESNLSKNGYSLILCNTDDDNEQEDKYCRLLLNRGIDALIFCPTNDSLYTLDIIKEFKENNVPIVVFDRYRENFDLPIVGTDNMKSAIMAVDKLISLGHKRIACLSGPLSSMSSLKRLMGYEESLKKNQIIIDEKLIRHGDYRYKSGYIETLKLLDESPSAIFVCNDMMAYGAYKAIEERGLSIPRDISIVGFDDLLFSEMLSVPLSSVRQDIDKISNKICEILQKELLEIKDNNTYLIDASLIVRNSITQRE